MTVSQFQGDHRFLSNFWPSPVQGPGGWIYPTVEHSYQAYKSNFASDWDHLANSIARPGDAKKYGRKIKVRADWEEVKVQVMTALLRQKFMSGGDLAKKLAAIEGDIVEGNRWGDTFWGVDLRTGQGENHLGKILMQLRDQLNFKPGQY